METKFKTKDLNGETVLIKTLDKKETVAVCPYSSPTAIPGQLQGQIQLIPRVCGNNCALFELVGNSVLLNCVKLSINLDTELNFIL